MSRFIMNLRQLDKTAQSITGTTTLTLSQVSNVEFGLALSIMGNMGAELDDGLDAELCTGILDSVHCEMSRAGEGAIITDCRATCAGVATS